MAKSTSVLVGAGVLWLFGCGGRAQGGLAEEPNHDAGGTASVSGGSETGGAPSSGGGSGQASLAGSAVGGAMAGPEGPKPPAPLQIAGRWAMFTFEDPVGVQLGQMGGELAGSGCASGAPPEGALPGFCGDVTGTVEGNRATFGFSFQIYRYQAETVISADGTRMTGRFHGAYDWIDYPMAWLRVPDDAQHLERRDTWLEPDTLAGSYALELVEGDGDEYRPGFSYRLSYSRRSIGGDLGSFWGTEASDPALGSPIHVGPVSATSPELPIELEIELGDAGLREVRATTASRHAYRFAVTSMPP